MTDGPEAALGAYRRLRLRGHELTHAGGHREIQLVGAQDQIADPPARFPVTRLR